MAYGLKVWDATGTTVVVDTSLFTARLVATDTISGDGTSQTINVSTAGGGTLRVIVTRIGTGAGVVQPPTVTKTNSSFTVVNTVNGVTYFYYAFRSNDS